MKKKELPQATVRLNWQRSTGKISSAWRRLVKKLFKKRGEPAGTRQDADEGHKED